MKIPSCCFLCNFDRCDHSQARDIECLGDLSKRQLQGIADHGGSFEQQELADACWLALMPLLTPTEFARVAASLTSEMLLARYKAFPSETFAAVKSAISPEAAAMLVDVARRAA